MMMMMKENWLGSAYTSLYSLIQSITDSVFYVGMIQLYRAVVSIFLSKYIPIWSRKKGGGRMGHWKNYNPPKENAKEKRRSFIFLFRQHKTLLQMSASHQLQCLPSPGHLLLAIAGDMPIGISLLSTDMHGPKGVSMYSKYKQYTTYHYINKRTITNIFIFSLIL